MGGHGVTGSADPPQVGGILRSPSGRADPLEREEVSEIDASAMAESVIKLPMDSSEQASSRQPPTVSDTTAAAFLRSTFAPPPAKPNADCRQHVVNFGHQCNSDKEKTGKTRLKMAVPLSRQMAHYESAHSSCFVIFVLRYVTL